MKQPDKDFVTHWSQRVVNVWTQDDTTMHDPDSEKPQQAFKRITRRDPPKKDDGYINYGDADEHRYYDHTLGHGCDGGWVGVIDRTWRRRDLEKVAKFVTETLPCTEDDGCIHCIAVNALKPPEL